MKSTRLWAASSSAIVLGLAGFAYADSTATEGVLNTEMASLRARVAELEGKQSAQWLDAQRTEEVKRLVREVLSDADTRASLQNDGLTAGYNNGRFFIGSQDGTFRLGIGGQVQVRYIHNERNDPDAAAGGNAASADPNEGGFQIRRMKLTFEGYIGNPKITYKVRLNADRNNDELGAEVALLGYKVTDQLTIMGGRYRDGFMKEAGVDDQYLTAVERSVVENIFTNGFVEGIQAIWTPIDMLKITASFTDGARSGEFTPTSNNDFNVDATNYAANARLDLKAMGEWKQADDFAAWTGGTALFFGIGGSYQEGETGDRQTSTIYDDNFRYTADVLLKSHGLSVFGAFVGQELRVSEQNAVSAGHTRENFGSVIQVGYFVIPDKFEPFARYEWLNIDSDSGSPGAVNIFTFGANYYFKKHAAKLTLDVVWAAESLTAASTFSGANSSQGLLPDSSRDEDQVAIRAQFQLLF